MPLNLRAVLGRPLTIPELDGNFEFLLDEIENFAPDTANEITSVVQSADNQTFTLYRADGFPLGPITIPRADFEFAGDWAPATGYSVGNLIVYERAGLYTVVQNHVSEATFDPAEENSDGPYYSLVLELFSGSAIKTWSLTNYTLQLVDSNRYLRFTATNGCVVTVPHNDDVEFPIGTEIHGRQAAANSVLIEGDTGVTVNASRTDYGTETPWQGANFTLKKVALNEWDYIGPGSEAT